MTRIKIVHNSDVRIISETVLKAQNPYTALVEYVRAIFHIPAQLEPSQLALAYSDDEGDIVTISSALELREAIRIAQQEHRRSLKLFLSTAGPEAAYLAARSALLSGAPSESFSDIPAGSDVVGSVSQAGAQSPRSDDGENSFVYVDEDAPAAVPAQGEIESDSLAVSPSEPAVSDEKSEEGEDEPDWTGFPQAEQLHEWFASFTADSTIQAQIPTAVTVTYDALLTGDSTLDQALSLAFDACPAIAEHPLVSNTRDFLPWIVKGVRQWVSTLVPLGEPMLQILAPQILQLLPAMFDGKRPDLQLDITDAFYQVRDQEKQKKKQEARKERRAAKRAEKLRARAEAAQRAAGEEESAESEDDDDDNEIHITVRVPKWLRQVLTQQGLASARGPCRRGRGRRGGCPWNPNMFGGLAGLFGQMMQGAQFGQPPQQPAPEAAEPAAPQVPDAPASEPSAASQPPPEKPQQQPLYDAHLDSQDAILPGTPLPPGAVVLKRWSLANTGSAAWPEGTRLIRRNVDRGFSMEHEFEVPLAAPGETVDIVALVNVPREEGKRFRASYRLRTPFTQGGTFLGPQVFVDFVVDPNAVVPEPEPTEEEKQQEQEQARLKAEQEASAAKAAAEQEQARIKAEQEAAAAKAAAEQEAARLKAEEEQREAQAALRRHEEQERERREREAFAGAAAAVVPQAPPAPHPQWEVQLAGLAGMGFKDRETNLFLLAKHNGDMHSVVSEILQGGH
jgi:hypothetical protein